MTKKPVLRAPLGPFQERAKSSRSASAEMAVQGFGVFVTGLTQQPSMGNDQKSVARHTSRPFALRIYLS